MYENEKRQVQQKQIQAVFDVSQYYMDICRHRMQTYSDRILYNKGGEKGEVFDIYKHQVAIRLHSQHDKNEAFKTAVTTCLNGMGKKTNDDQENINRVWNDMYVVGVTKNNVHISDPGKKQHPQQTNVIVHGDAQIYNNSIHRWFPGQILVIKPPYPNPNHNISMGYVVRLGDFPENAFYPIVEPLQHNSGMIPNAVNFLNYIHHHGTDKEIALAPWITELNKSIIQTDIVKGIVLAKVMGENIPDIDFKNDDSLREYAKQLYPLDDPDNKVHTMFALFDELHHHLNGKMVGKSCSFVPSGYQGMIVRST